MIPLPTADEVNEENVVEKLQQTLLAISDSSGTADMSLAVEIRGLREDMNHGFARVDRRFDRVDKRFDRLENKFDNLENRFDNLENRFDNLENRFDNLENEFSNLGEKVGGLENKVDGLDSKIDTHLSEQTKLLKMIVENTKP